MTDKKRGRIEQPVVDQKRLAELTEAAETTRKQLENAQLAAQAAQLALDAETNISSIEDVVDLFGENGLLDTTKYMYSHEAADLFKLVKGYAERYGYSIDQYGGVLMKQAPDLLLKWVHTDGTPIYSNDRSGKKWSMPVRNPDGSWTPGDWWEAAGQIVTCQNGLHATTLRNLDYWGSQYSRANRVIAIVETEGPVFSSYQKIVARRMRLLRLVEIETGLAEAARKLFMDEGDHEKVVRRAATTGLNKKDADAAMTLSQGDWHIYRRDRINELMAEDHLLQADTYRHPDHKKNNNDKRDALKTYRGRLSYSYIDPYDEYARAKNLNREELENEYLRRVLGL